ncbi:MAG: cytochrome c3 family protein [Thermodesulfobacteriota bacterium]
MARFTHIAALMLCCGVLPALSPAIGISQAFHSGGTGSCSGCHAMHSGQPGSQWLLQKSDPSSICLNCHSGIGGPNSPSVFSPDGSALTPGGDFYWLTRNFSWTGGQSPGYEHGHNIIARDYNLLADPILFQAPGGTYPAARLGCTSCHDPHGQVRGGSPRGGLPVSGSGSYGEQGAPGAITGNFRLLGDSFYSGGSGNSFSHDAPIARQSSISKFRESDASHVDYGSGMSEWCGNCHSGVLNNEHQPAGGFEHPVNEKLDGEIITNYNTYLRTGDFSGMAANAYLQFVPFERGVSNQELLDPNSRQGPDANANVMCLTCHRAHASAFDNSGRWDFKASLLTQSHPAIGDAGATPNDVIYSYYGRDIAAEFGSGQRQFCEKCHGSETP